MSDDHEYSVTSAQAAAARGELDDWVARFLASPGSDNAPLAEKLAEPRRWWLGPVEIPLDDLHRLAGPPDAPALVPVDDDFWRDDVDEMAERIDDDGWEPPPVVATHQDGRLVLEDGNHRVEGLRRAGQDRAWTVIGFDDPEERDRFVARAPS